MLDYSANNPRQKLYYWRPRSAWLYNESAEGKLKYTNNELENEVFTATTESKLKYNLQGCAWPGLFGVSASKYHPKVFYIKNKN